MGAAADPWACVFFIAVRCGNCSTMLSIMLSHHCTAKKTHVGCCAGPISLVLITCQVYGLGGVGIVIEALSDNNARAAATVREVVKKGGAKMADPGSVLFNFKRYALHKCTSIR